jgi:signal recognition particle GTPase
MIYNAARSRIVKPKRAIITPETWEDLETLLVQADVGIETAEEILEELRIVVRDQGLIHTTELSAALRNELRARLDSPPVLQWT